MPAPLCPRTRPSGGSGARDAIAQKPRRDLVIHPNPVPFNEAVPLPKERNLRRAAARLARSAGLMARWRINWRATMRYGRRLGGSRRPVLAASDARLAAECVFCGVA